MRILGLVFLFAGGVNLLGVLSPTGSWYWNLRKVQRTVRWFGQGPARVFYLLMSLAFLATGGYLAVTG